MADAPAQAWPRPYFQATEQHTKVFFVCFGKAPLAELPLSRARFGLPDSDVLTKVDVREHSRATSPAWFEGWWAATFRVVAERDLGDDLALLTTSDVCVTIGLELPDHPDLAPQQVVWGVSRWLCERGALVVLDVHAFLFRTRQDIEQLSFESADVVRDVKLVLESEPTRGSLHLMHTRGLCKFARPELLCYIDPDDASLMGRVLNQLARTLMEGAVAPQLRLKVAEGVELVTRPSNERGLLESLGLEQAVELERSDGSALAGIGRLGPAQ